MWPALLIYGATVAAQALTLGRTVLPALDEGVYLCSARLVAGGAVPYRDFFLGHPPWAVLGAAAGLTVTGWSIPLFSFLYTLWVFSSVFAVYSVVEHATGRRGPAVLSALLFVTFPEFARWDAHFFALRQASVPFLSFALYFWFVKRRAVPAGLLLGVFAACVLSNAAVALCVLAAFAAGDLTAGRNAGDVWREHRSFIAVFGATAAVLVLPLLLVPGAFGDLVSYQVARSSMPAGTRLASFFGQTLPQNAPILVAGLAGSLLRSRRLGLFGLSNLAALPILVFASRSYYPHYLSVLAVGLAIGGGLLFGRATSDRMQAGLAVGTGLGLLLTAGPILSRELFLHPTPEILRTIAVLRSAPEPVFSFEPIYALYAGRSLTPHRFVCDMRTFRVLRRDPGDAYFLDVLSRSRTVLVEPSMGMFLSPARWEALRRDFDEVRNDGLHRILVRKSGHETSIASP